MKTEFKLYGNYFCYNTNRSLSKKFKLIMAVSQEKSTIVVVRFSFKATEKRKYLKS